MTGGRRETNLAARTQDSPAGAAGVPPPQVENQPLNGAFDKGSLDAGLLLAAPL